MKTGLLAIGLVTVVLVVLITAGVRWATDRVYPGDLPNATTDNSGWYFVKPGDSWSSVAETFYGNPNYWWPLKEENEARGIQVSPLQTGQRIVVLGAKMNTHQLSPLDNEAGITPRAARLNSFSVIEFFDRAVAPTVN